MKIDKIDLLLLITIGAVVQIITGGAFFYVMGYLITAYFLRKK